MIQFSEKLRYQASDVRLTCLAAIEEFAAETDQDYRKRTMRFDMLGYQTQAEYVGRALWLIHYVHVAKDRELARALIRAANEEDYLVFALCGRAVIETTATLYYYDKKIMDIVKAAKDPDAFSVEEFNTIRDLVDRQSRGGRFDWQKFWTSPRLDMAKELVAAKKKKEASTLPNPHQVSAQTAIDAWATKDPRFTLFYDYFCELVHPNLGSNFLTMGLRDGAFELCGETVKGVGRSLVLEGIEFLAPVLKEALRGLAILLGRAATTLPQPE